MRVRSYVAAVAIAFSSAAVGLSAEPESISGLGPTGPVVKVHGDFKFTEGPAADRRGNLFFTDVPASRIYKLDARQNLSIFREPSGTSNGLMWTAAGELLACEMEGRVVAISADGQQARPLAATYQDRRFNAPNDLVLDRAGGVYFTDPHFRAPTPLPQGVTAVYYVAVDGRVTRLIDDLKAPNGVILSPDEKTLYVIPSLQAEMMAYAVEGPGKLDAGRVFCSLRQPPGEQNRGGDGLTVDASGNLYIATGLGLQVFNAQGEPLGEIALPEQPSNCTFGGPDLRTLYVTARTSLYAVPMEVAGHVFGGEAPQAK